MKIYIDCDGVILDTIDRALMNMKEENLDITNRDVVNNYFVNVDWFKLINDAGQLDNSIEKIKRLIDLGYDITILTTCVNKIEPFIKKSYFASYLPGIEVITVPWKVRKDSVVSACDNILIDDSMENIRNWREAGGIGVLFVKEQAIHEKMVINNISDITLFTGKEKKLVR